MKMPSSELKYCHFIPGLDFRLSANTAIGRERVRTRKKKNTLLKLNGANGKICSQTVQHTWKLFLFGFGVQVVRNTTYFRSETASE